MSKDQFFHPDKLKYSKDLLEEIKHDLDLPEKPGKRDSRFILYNIHSRISHANSDAEAKQAVLEYITKIPVQVPAGEGQVRSFGNMMIKIREPITTIQLPSGNPLSERDANELKSFYDHFIDQYKTVSNSWQFDYPKTPDGEIMSEQFAFWQKALMDETVSSNPDKAYKDFKRGYDINGVSFDVHIDRLKKNAKDICVVSLQNAMNISKLPDLENTAYLIRTRIPDTVWYVNKANKEELTKIDMSKEELTEFDKHIKPDKNIQSLASPSKEQLGSVAPIIHNRLERDIDKSIPDLCNKLDETPENKKLLEKWLKKFGGQDNNRFVDASLMEQHFGNLMALADTKPTLQNWTVKNNHIVFDYAMNVNAMIVDAEVYAKEKNQPFIKKSDNPEDITANTQNYNPLMKIKGEVMLSIEENNQGEKVVKPKLVKYEVDCRESLTETGKILFQSPAKNPDLIATLKQTPETPEASETPETPKPTGPE